MSSYIIRRALPADAASLSVFAARLFRSTYSDDTAAEDLEAYIRDHLTIGHIEADITDPEGADRKSGNIQNLRNRVAITEPAGSDTFVTMNLSGKDVIARMRADASVAPGQVFDFAVNMEKAVAFDPKSEERIRA